MRARLFAAILLLVNLAELAAQEPFQQVPPGYYPNGQNGQYPNGQPPQWLALAKLDTARPMATDVGRRFPRSPRQ